MKRLDPRRAGVNPALLAVLAGCHHDLYEKPKTRGLVGFPRADGSATDLAGMVRALNENIQALQTANNTRMEELARGQQDVVRSEEVGRINASITRLQEEIAAQAQLIAGQRVGQSDTLDPNLSAVGRSAEAQSYRRTFSEWARGQTDDQSLRGAARPVNAAMHRESDTDGGFFVPEEIDRNIIRVLGVTNIMRQLATVRAIGAPSLRRAIQTQGAAAGWVGEREARPETATPKWAEQVIDTHEMYANPAATQSMIDDATFNIETFLPDEVRDSFADLEGAAFISGNGIKKPMGLLSYSLVADGSWTWGSIRTLNSGAAATIDSTDDLINFMTMLRPGYLGNARWLMNRLTQATVRLFKDTTGQYVWQAGLQQGVPNLLLGYPIALDDNMPNIGAGALPIAFGDFMRAYLILDRMGMRVLRDPYTNKPYVHFYCTRRVGGAVQNFEAFVVMTIAA
jgi:HK97 family phage major capsid protein